MSSSQPFQTSDSTKWHKKSIDETLAELHTTQDGLSDQECAKRLSQYGANRLPDKKAVTLWEIIQHQLINPLIFILFAATIASVVIGEVTDALFILIVIVLNTSLGAYQEFHAEKSASGLQKMLKIKAVVIRNGKRFTLPSEELVPGDIVLLESGNKVPADLRLIETNNLTVDESFLTGESLAISKHNESLLEDAEIGDRKNMTFAGGTVLSGRAKGVVVATGLHTQVGIIAENVSTTSSAKPPLVIRMERFTRNISIIVVVLSFILAFLLYFQGYDSGSIFFFVVALAVSAIPEGLPVALTVVLSIATKRMSKRNVIVRKLNAVESLGSCSVIASDKTGTLTVNQQTVRLLVFPDNSQIQVSGEGYNGEGELTQNETKLNHTHTALAPLLRTAVLANEAKLIQRDDEWEFVGDSMDVALLALGYKAEITPASYKNDYQLVTEIPYEPENKYAGAIHSKDGRYFVSMKGAVETVLTHCAFQFNLETGEESPLESAILLTQVEEMASAGLRVLGFAGKESESDNTLENLTFYGLVGFIDPLRAEAKEAVRKCKDAGIRVLMITGDHPSTAGAIAYELGLENDKKNVITGTDLKELSSEKFTQLIASSNVFARVSPIQKLEIVDDLIEHGDFVAVTGDGINDTPALRRANIGVAMGSGTDIAKDVGSMIIVDDNFSSIVSGVEEGRFAYDNVRKVIYLLISTGAAEVVLFIASIIVGLPLPLLAVQLLWLNLVTNGIQDVALAFEGGEEDAMKRKPRKSSEKIFNAQMIKQTVISGMGIGLLVFAIWYWLKTSLAMNEFEARNIVLLIMVLIQNVHVFSCRSEFTSAFRVPISKNYILIFGVLGAQLLHIACMHIPFMQGVLGVQPISATIWIQCLGVAFIPLLLMESVKFFSKNK